MNKILLIVIIMIITITAQANEKTQQEKVNDIILTYQFEAITHNGIQGFFIPFVGYKNLLLTLNDYVYLQQINYLKDEKIKILEKDNFKLFKYKTALGISISFNIGATFLAAGLGLLTYNLARR